MSVKRLLIEILGRDVSASRELRGVAQELNSVRQASDLVTGALRTAGVLGLAYMGQQAVEAAWNLGQLGARARDVERNLIAFAGGAGRAAQFASAVADASGRTINQMQAAATASRLLQMGIAGTAEEMRIYVEGATRLGDQTLSASQRISSMVDFLKNQNLMMADNFGLSRMRIQALRDELLATQGLSREQATYRAIQEEIARQLEVLGPRAEDGAEAFDQLRAATQDLKLALADGLAPAMIDLARLLTQVAHQAPDTANQLIILAEAAATAAGAAITGQDAELAFLESVARSAGMEDRIARLRHRAAQERIADIEREIAGWREAAARGDIMAASQIRLLEAELSEARAAEKSAWAAVRAAEATDQWGAKLSAQIGLMERAGPKISGLVSAYLMLSDATREWVQARTDADIAGMDAYEDREAALDALGRMEAENARKRADAEEAAALTAQRAWQSSYNAQQRAYEDLRRTVRSALRPTQVTALDMGLSDIGQYVDQWDENARRLDAIAQRGFAELQQHADWASVLKIPPEVLAAGEAALRDWAARTAGAVRNLQRPDLLNIDAAVAAVQAELDRQAAVELSLDLVTKAAVERGLVGGEDAKQRVAQALGLEQALPVTLAASDTAWDDLVASLSGPEGTSPSLPVTLTVTEEGEGGGGATALGQVMGESLLAGVGLALNETQAMATFVQAIEDDMNRQRGRLEAVGTQLWQIIEVPLLQAMAKTPFVHRFARLVSPYVLEELEKRGRFGG
ncbi:MAG TPA: hypothetical protein ENJ31_01605 [Anaerolineae bacterium]|nr:hypothetical protein [Anaerolineae bacterium]